MKLGNMSKNRYSARSDNNQKKIVSELRQAGLSVITGMDDLAVGHKNITLLVEVKNKGCYSKKTGELLEKNKTPRQKKLDETFSGARIYINCTEDVLRWFGVIK